MPAIPQHRRRITPSARVGGAIIPTDIADVGGIGGGIAALGRGVSTLGRFLFRIKSDQIALNDSIANIEAGTITDATNAEIRTVQQTLPNRLDDKGNSTWEGKAGEIFDTNFEKIGQLNMSDRQREITVAKWEADKTAAISRSRFASVNDTIKRGKANLELLIKEAVITGIPQKAQDAQEMTAEMGGRIWDNEKVMSAEIARWQREAKQEKLVLENQQKARDKEALEAQREIDRDAIGNDLATGTATFGKVDASSLSEKEQEAYRLKIITEAERRAKGETIVEDQGIKGELERQAYDITSGAVSIQDFNKRLEEAYRDDKINETTRSSLKRLAEGKFESYQDKAMKERETYAFGQLVDQPDEADFTEFMRRLTGKFEREQARSLRKLQFDNLDQYKRALRDWRLRPENKDADAREIYEEGRALLTEYRLSPQQLRDRAKRIQFGLAIDKSLKAAGGLKALPKTKPTGIKVPDAPRPQKELEKSVGKENAKMETRAWGVVVDLWNNLSREAQQQIRKDRAVDKTFTEIITSAPVVDEIERLTGISSVALPAPKTQEEYDRLPSGTKYIHPDGTQKTKR